jgi:NAD-dependent dihydropyrimidine dehydrogenase PreA subunit
MTGESTMYSINVNAETCEGCGDCVGTCPVDMFEVKENKAVVIGNQEDCVGCESCVSVCPSSSVTVEEK